MNATKHAHHSYSKHDLSWLIETTKNRHSTMKHRNISFNYNDGADFLFFMLLVCHTCMAACIFLAGLKTDLLNYLKLLFVRLVCKLLKDILSRNISLQGSSRVVLLTWVGFPFVYLFLGFYLGLLRFMRLPVTLGVECFAIWYLQSRLYQDILLNFISSNICCY